MAPPPAASSATSTRASPGGWSCIQPSLLPLFPQSGGKKEVPGFVSGPLGADLHFPPGGKLHGCALRSSTPPRVREDGLFRRRPLVIRRLGHVAPSQFSFSISFSA